MRFKFLNYWRGSSFKDGGAFPITLIGIGGGIHPSFREFGITIFNFYFGIGRKEERVKW